MADQDVELNLLMRLIVMGVDVQKEEITYKMIHDNKVSPTFLDIYPSLETEQIPPYMENFKMWGFVEGFKIFDEQLKVLNEEEDDEGEESEQNSKKAAEPENKDIKNEIKIYSFVMTDANYCKRYCTTLLFYERYYVRKDDAYSTRCKESTLMPKSSLQDLLVKYPYTMNDHDLVYIPKSITLVSRIPSFDAQKQILYYFYDSLLKKDDSQPDRNIRIPRKYLDQFENILNKKKQEQSDVQIDDMWSQIFSYDRNLYLKSHKKADDILIKETQLREFYVSAIFSLLDLVNGPLERVILKLHNSSKDEELIRYRINNAMGIDLPPTGYKTLFKKLSPRNFVKVFRAILLEKQIIFFSSYPGEIPHITEAFISLLSPMLWCCIYIPYLPLSLWEVIHAIMPFMVGVLSEHKEFISNSIDLKDKVIVDLDNDTVEFDEDDLPQFPRRAQDYLISKLEELYKAVRNLEPKKGKETWVEITLRCRHYFNVFLLSIINNIIPFFKHTEAEALQKFSASEVFDFDAYYAQFPDQDSRTFAIEFGKTMMFSKFVEDSYLITSLCDQSKKGSWEDQVDEISAFLKQLKLLKSKFFPEIFLNDTYLQIFHPKSITHIDTMNGAPIQQATQRYFAPENIDLLPYLIKYYYRFFADKKTGLKLPNLNSPHILNSLSSGNVGKTSSSPVNKSSFANISSHETMALNKSSQSFPPLNKSRLVDLKAIFTDDFIFGRESASSARAHIPKFPIFSEPKPIYKHSDTQNEVIQLMEAQKAHSTLPLAEPPINNPTNLLRKSNYFLYYQIIKRNEILLEDVRKASEYEISQSSPEKRMSKKSQRFRFSTIGRDSQGGVFDDNRTNKSSINEISPSLKFEHGFSFRNTNLFGKKTDRTSGRRPPLKQEKTLDDISHFKEITLKRSATDNGPQPKEIDEEEELKWDSLKKKNRETKNKNFKGLESLFDVSKARNNHQVMERKGDSPVSSPVSKNQHEFLSKKSMSSKFPQAHGSGAKKHIFELKAPMKTNNDLIGNNLKLVNRSYSANDDGYGNRLKTEFMTTKKAGGVISNQKLLLSKGDLDPNPISPNKPRGKIFGEKQVASVRAFSVEESPKQTKGKENRKGFFLKKNLIEEFKDDFDSGNKKEKSQDITSVQYTEQDDEGVLIKNLDTGEMVPMNKIPTIKLNLGKKK